MKVKVLGTNKDNFSLIINENIIVNLGESSINKLLKSNYDLSKIDTIIITNVKQNNISSYPLLLVDLDKLGVRHKINIYLPKNGLQVLNDLLYKSYNTYFDSYIKEYIVFNEILDKQIININDTSIKFISVSSDEILGYGLIVDEKLGFTGETAICDNVKEIFKKSDLVIADCTNIEGSSSHLGIDDIIVLSAEYQGVKILPVYLTDETKEELIYQELNKVIIPNEDYTCILN